MSVSKYDALGYVKLHKELLSDRERNLLKNYLDSGKKGDGFRMLKLRIKQNYPCISEDFALINKVIDNLSEKSS